MSKISELKMRGKTLVEVYVDGESIGKMHVDVCVASGLISGKEVSIEKLKELQASSNFTLAKEKALNYISKSMRTQKQVITNLMQKGFDIQVCYKVVDFLKGYKYLNDENYALAFVSQNQHRFGRKKLKLELLQKGVSKQDIDKAIQTSEFDFENVFLMLHKFMKNKDKDIKNKSKAYRFLMSKGFSSDECMSVINKIFGSGNDDWN